MNSFTLTQATAADEAVRDFASHDGAAYLGGGTNLIDLMKYNLERPSHLTSVFNLPLTDISSLPEGGLRLGALATNADTAWHPEVEKRYPLLSQTILAGATPQLRNAATNGGNLNQRTRCYYFYDLAAPCNKREPGTGCSALTGPNRVCGVLGTSESCIATHPSDMCVALAALEAVVRVQGPNGERTIKFEDYHRLPGDRPEKDNTLEPGELVTAIDLPAEGYAEHFTYLKLRDRSSYAFALVSVAVGLKMNGNTIEKARFALGGVVFLGAVAGQAVIVLKLDGALAVGALHAHYGLQRGQGHAHIGRVRGDAAFAGAEHAAHAVGAGEGRAAVMEVLHDGKVVVDNGTLVTIPVSSPFASATE